MKYNPELKFLNSGGMEPHQYLCFKHAVLRAVKGEDIEPEIDEYGDEYDMRNIGCVDCLMEPS